MSEDDKKRDRALQRRVRDRQDKTGESYQAAWRQLTGSEPPTEDAPPQTIEDAVIAEGAPPPQDQQRRILSLHLPRVLPQQPTRVTTRAKEGAVDIERLFITSAGTAGGAADWIVNDIEVDGRSQLTLKNLSGALFGSRGVAANRKAATTFSMAGFDPVEHGHELTIIVTYVGPNPEGVPFFASAFGTSPPQRLTVVPISSSTPVPPLTKTTITVRAQSAPFQTERFEIDDGATPGGAADWIVHDLRVDEQSQFAQTGDIPGDMFAIAAIDSFIKPWEEGHTIEIDVTYVGLNEGGACFAARLEGTVVRNDYAAAPPDLRVRVEVDGKHVGDVVATCNWRPAPSNLAS